MPAWAEAARLDLGQVLTATGHREARQCLPGHREARQTLLDAHHALTALRSPRQAEAAAALASLDKATAAT
ncbi:hypothetical protein ABZ299_19215 [Streptomyces sp. NPDC006184]|uniref:hypothetical protein n=1 Tax=Streptomyces sp. NPDC006184 TaxID=3155455 RepID=UPI0033B2554A